MISPVKTQQLLCFDWTYHNSSSAMCSSAEMKLIRVGI